MTRSDLGQKARRCIDTLRRDLRPRIERILGARGGLLVVLDQVLGGGPIALIDLRTLRGLERLGAASPTADADTLYRASTALEPTAPAELLLGALLHAAAVRAGRANPPEPARTAVWPYGEALPAGRLAPDDAALILRAQGLARAGDAMPPGLLAALAADAAAFVAGSEAGGWLPSGESEP